MSVQDFFPPDYDLPKSGDKYTRLQDGQNRLRILSAPIFGYVWWEDTDDGRRPVRVPYNKVPSNPDYKHFWAMKVYNHDKECVQVLEVTQRTIQEAIRDLQMNVKWGDPRAYDIVIVRKGEGLETTYGVQPEPKEVLTAEIKKAHRDTPVDLEALYRGEDPFEVLKADGKSEPDPTVPEDILEGGDVEDEVDDDDLPF